MTLGERIKFVRKDNKLNQTEFAQQLGIGRTYVSKIEKNVENPSETLLLFISYKFAVNIDWLKNETGSYNEEFGCDTESCRDKLIYICHKLQLYTANMISDSIWEYVTSIENFSHVIICCDKTKVDEPEVIAYYTCIKKIMAYLWLLTGLNNGTKSIDQLDVIKQKLNTEIENLINLYNQILKM